MITKMNTQYILLSERKHSAWSSFVAEMVGKQYGAEETREAWLWFRAGWDAHVRI
jgi:hypothetical protein